ncbi:hypothetical protein [Paenibacillus sp. B-A-8]|uniref:hypothetical protein n=1 Tax=Paenibacillus sp. B-A-8 TaxID=3400419 RepID=UPI003B012873
MSENKIVNPEHFRVLRVKLRWTGSITWEADSVYYQEYIGPLGKDALTFGFLDNIDSTHTNNKVKVVNFHLEYHPMSVGKRFVDDINKPSDLSIRLGLINPKEVNIVFMIGNYNFIEVVVEGERNLNVILPGGTEQLFMAGMKSLLDLRNGIRDSEIISTI